MDLPSLNALLRVNGLTKDSAPENITDVLLRSGYKEDEIPQALEVLKGAPPPPAVSIPGAYVGQIVEHTRLNLRGDSGSIFAGRIGVKQFWLGIGLAFGIYGLAFIIVEASAVPIFTLTSGISLFSHPDLATAPVESLLLFGIGASMLVLPALFFLAIAVGLQVRRCHDYGLSGAAWFMAMAALVVGAYLLDRLTPLAALSVLAAFAVWAIFMSWPGTQGENFEGSQATYPSIWGALYGSYSETGCLNSFVRTFLLPLAYLQLFGIMLGVSIHSVLPRAHLPNIS